MSVKPRVLDPGPPCRLDERRSGQVVAGQRRGGVDRGVALVPQCTDASTARGATLIIRPGVALLLSPLMRIKTSMKSTVLPDMAILLTGEVH